MNCYVLELVYRSLVLSVLTFNIVTWYGNLRVKERTKLNRIVNLASKIIGKQQEKLSDIFYKFSRRKAIKIVNDSSHPLNSNFTLLRSGRRYKVPLAKRNLHKFSFVPSAINILNGVGAGI